LFRFYCHEVLNISQPKSVIGAGDFWTNYDSDPILKNNFIKIPNTADFKPLRGDVMIWNKKAGGGFGHIAICTGENTGLQYFKSFDQNWSKVSYCEIVNHTYTNVYGVFRPKVQSTQETMQIEKAVFEKLVDKSTKYDSFVEAGYLDAKSVTLSIETYNDRINTLKKDHNNFLREMVTILDPNTSLEIADQDLVKNLAKQVVSDFSNVQSELTKKEKEWATTEKELENENSQLEQQVKSLKQELEDMRLKHEQEILRLEKRIEQVSSDVEKNKEQKAQNTALYDLIISIKKFFERK
jgi:hypothetical protein